MAKYEEKISDESVWVTATPTGAALTLPFYATEAGHFCAREGYAVERDRHESFLILYTVSGTGVVTLQNSSFELRAGQAAVIDCRSAHKYCCENGEWNFLWTHINGSAAEPLWRILYADAPSAVNVSTAGDFADTMSSLIRKINRNDILSSADISSDIHILFNLLIKSGQENEKSAMRSEHTKEIKAVIDFIEKNYSESVSVDDMIREIHVSKYHFIRVFRRIMGITPYSYLTNYRINMSKLMLRTTDKTVSEIAFKCGFLDTSNFITHFRTHTGQKPLQYRRDFS